MNHESIPAQATTPRTATFEGLMQYAELLLKKSEESERILDIVESLNQFLDEQKIHAQQALVNSPDYKLQILSALGDIFERAIKGAYQDLESA